MNRKDYIYAEKYPKSELIKNKNAEPKMNKKTSCHTGYLVRLTPPTKADFNGTLFTDRDKAESYCIYVNSKLNKQPSFDEYEAAISNEKICFYVYEIHIVD